MLLVVLRAPELTPSLLKDVAMETGLATADLRQRMVGQAPWVVVVAADPAPLHDMVPALARLQVQALVCDPEVVPCDDDRILVRQLSFSPTHLQVIDGAGQTHECAYDTLSLLVTGRRTQVTVETTESSQRRFSATKALLTGGILLTSKHTVREQRSVAADERFVLISRNDNGADLILYERRIDYRSLGTELQPSSYANLERVLAMLVQRSGASVDDRLAQPGFVARMPKVGVEQVDLALYLVQLARAAVH